MRTQGRNNRTPDESDALIAFHATQNPITDADAPSLGASASVGIQQRGTVRRLTPLERERLIGWEDDHTAWGIDEHGQRVELSDTARDRLTGNGVVTTVARWIGDRIHEVHNRQEQA